MISGRVQEWTDRVWIGDPEGQLHSAIPQASADQSRAASFQTWHVPLVKDVNTGPPARARPPVILRDEVSTLNIWANKQLICRLLNFDRAV